MTKTCAIYTRVSTRAQSEDGASLDTQLEECRALADELGLEVVSEFTDTATGTARSKKVRPGYFAMMAAVRSGAAHHVIAWKEDRLYRGFGVVPFYELVEELKLTPKRVHVVHGNWDRKMMLLMAGIAQVELEDIKLRTIAGRKRSLREGKWIFPPPFGYELVDGALLVNAAEAAALVEMLTLYSSGIPHTAVRSHLEKGTSRYPLRQGMVSRDVPPLDPQRGQLRHRRDHCHA